MDTSLAFCTIRRTGSNAHFVSLARIPLEAAPIAASASDAPVFDAAVRLLSPLSPPTSKATFAPPRAPALRGRPG